MLRSAKNENAVCFVVSQDARFHLRTPQGTKCLVLGLVVLVLSHWDTRDDLHEHTFSNTGNIPTLHQPKVTVITVTLTSAHGGVPILNIHLTIYSIWQISQRMVVSIRSVMIHTYCKKWCAII